MKLLYTTFFVLVAALRLGAQCNGVFSDDFETGAPSPSWAIGTGHTMVVSNTAPAAGTYSMDMTGSSAFYSGPNVMFPASQPTYISWRIKTNTVSAANGYFVLGDANINSDNGILFAYCNASSGLRFYGATGYNYPIVANTWYHVEVMNINWTARTMDIYVNSVLILPGWPFRSTTATSMDRLHTFNLSTATASYDNIIIGGVPVTVSNSTVSPLCNAAATGSIDLTVSGGTPPYSYSWSNSASTQDLNSITAGTYSVVVTDNIGCTTNVSVTLTQPPAISLSATTTNVNCFAGMDGTADLTATGGTPGYTYSWSSGATTEDEPSLAAGTYTLLLTDANGCNAVLSGITITEPSEVTAAVSVTDVTCNGSNTGSATMTVSGGIPGYTYSWSPAGGTNATATGLSAGTYTCNITDNNGCILPQTCSISEPAIITVTASGTDLTCNGDSTGTALVNVTGGIPGYSYNWMPGNMSNANIPALAAGTYTCTVTDMNGCTNTGSITITEPSLITASATSTSVSCAGGSDGSATLTVSGGTPGYSYSWGNGDTSAMADSLSGGTHSCTITDMNGCLLIQQVIVSEPSPIVINLAVTNASSCGGNEGSIDATPTGGTGSYTYSWSNGPVTQDNFTLSAGTYSITVTDTNGCVSTNNATVLNPPLPTVSVSFPASTFCFDDANFTLSGGSPAGGIWSGAGVSSGMFDPSAAGNGTTPITYTYTDGNNCTASAVSSVTVNACVGIEETSVAIWNVYPNPTNGTFTLSTNNNSGDVIIEVLDVQGRIIFSENENNVAPGFSTQVSIENVSNGMYILRIVNTTKSTTEIYKIAVQN